MHPLQWLPNTYSYPSQLSLMSSRKPHLKIPGYRHRLKTFYRLFSLLKTTDINSMSLKNYESIRKRLNLGVLNVPGENHLNFKLTEFKRLAEMLRGNIERGEFRDFDYNDEIFDTLTHKELHEILRSFDRHARARFIAGIREVELKDFFVSRPGLVWKFFEGDGSVRNMKWNEMFWKVLEFTEKSHDRLYSEEEVYQMELPEVKRLIEEEVGLPWDGLKYYGFVGPGRRKAMEESEKKELARKLLANYYTWFDDDFTLDPDEPLGINIKKYPMKGMGWDLTFRPTSYTPPLSPTIRQSLSAKPGVLASTDVSEQTKMDILESRKNSKKRHSFKPDFFAPPKFRDSATSENTSATKRWSYETDTYVEEDRGFTGLSENVYSGGGKKSSKEELLKQIRNPEDGWRKKQAEAIEDNKIEVGREEPWIKKQQRKILEKFEGGGKEQESPSEFKVQDEWLAMERRTKNRRLVKLNEAGGKLGRRNVKKTDEDYWIQAGVYEDE
ncbi:hypothetical protein TrLO_g13325 [Triparma laevis f. longispina]|nr:hypothetical protein TrLO_g13325 [Triparma laevis f. longispina]